MSMPMSHMAQEGSREQGEDRATLLHLIRSWAAALVAQHGLGWAFTVAVFAPLASEERLDGFGWRLLLLHIPALLAVFAGVFAAARIHQAPGRLSRPRHLTAALAAPLAGLAFTLGTTWNVVNPEGVGMAFATFAFGAATALSLDYAMSNGDHDRRRPAGPGGFAGGRYRHHGWDRGATASEYLGVIVVVSSLTLAIGGTSLGTSVKDALMCQIRKATGGGACVSSVGTPSTPKTNADYQPKFCSSSKITDTAGAKAKIAWFEWGNEYGFQQQTILVNEDVNGDGQIDGDDQKVALTFTDAASVGATGSGKPKLQVGKLGAEEVELGGGIKVTNGDTWIFDGPEEAEQFRDDIEEMKMWEASMKYSGAHPNIYGAYKWADKKEEIEEKLSEKHISYGKIGLDVNAKAGLKVSAGDEKRLSAALKGKFKFSPDVTITNNNVRGHKSYTYSATLEYGSDVTYEAGPLNGEYGAMKTRTGSMTVSYDQETGELVRIDMIQTIETGGKTDGAKGKSKKDNSGGAKGTSDNPTQIHVLTNTIKIPPGPEGDADRRIAQEWLDGSGNNTAPFAYMFGDHALNERPSDDDPFGQLMFDKAMSSKMQYNGTTDAAEYGFELSLGLSLGMSVSMEHKEEHISDAQFLGAPRNGKRSYVPYSYCAQ